ncbi:MAG: hypothetical protein J7M25_12745, partial [Deltaproteobacteria bacterium]|nr:hypothetical protein [Deltaproteobacteria bacterium]
DLYSTFQFGLDLREGHFAVGLSAALRVKVVDRGGTGSKGFRHRDWDEPSDFAHIVRYMSYRKQMGPVHLGLMIGELATASLGHRSILDQYLSVADLDHPHSGAWIRVGHRYVSFDFLTGNFVDPHLLAGRVEIRPVPSLRRLVIGVTGLVDLKAPVSVRRDDRGEARVDHANHLLVDRDQVGFVGFDAAYTWRFGQAELTPFVDGNWMVGSGGGLHLGGTARIAAGRWSFAFTGTYHLAVDGYRPGYVDMFYDVQRYQLALGRGMARRIGSLDPKLAVQSRIKGAFHGGRFVASVDYGDSYRMEVGYDMGHSVAGDLVWMKLDVPYGRRFVFGALAARTGFLSSGDWREAGGTMAGVETRFRLFRYMYLLGQLRYLYLLDGRYQGVLLANVAVGGSWDY